jgi:hypothetical protein
MKSIILGTMLLSLLSTVAFANDPHAPAPAPTPAATAINQNNIGNYNSLQNKQLQFQGQFQGQGQQQRSTNTNSVNGGNVTVNNTAPGSTTPAAAAPANTTVNNNGSAQPSATYANVHTSSDGVNPWTNPVASAVAPSVYAASICQSAISGAAQTPLFGLSFGSVQGLDVCIKMMLAEQAKTDGRADVANYFRCQTKEFRDAYKATGTPCPQDAPKQTASAIPTPASQGIVVSSVAGQPTNLPANCHLVQPGNYVTCD